MSVTPKALINAQYVAGSTTQYFTSTTARVIIDKFTATNTDAGALTLTVFLVEAGGTQGAQHTVVSAQSIAAGATADITALQNQILNPNDKLYAAGSSGSKIVIRMSGREVT